METTVTHTGVLPNPFDRPTLTVPEAGLLLGLCRASAYDAAKRGEIPTLRVGRRLLVPTAGLLRMLGIGVLAANERGEGSRDRGI